jgi:hypothetical protein
MWRIKTVQIGVVLIGWGLMGGCGGGASNQGPAESAKATSAMPERPQSLDSMRLVELGDSLTTTRQQLMLQRLLQASEKEGWGGALRYCHLAAETLAYYQSENLSLQRLAERYRNPKNKLQDSLDQAAFTYFQTTQSKTPIVWKTSSEWRYYRPIYIMPTCLKCHGSKEELDALALTEIRKHYPGDKASGFQMGDLRGLWRMTYTASP